MKRNMVWILRMAIILPTFATVFVGCAVFRELNEENFSQGLFILDKVLTNHYDSSIPIEEQCYLIVLDFHTMITLINDKKAGDKIGMNESPNVSLNCNQITILPPGQHKFNFHYYERRNSSQYEARGSRTYNLQAGHYYFLTSVVSGNSVGFLLDDLENYSIVKVYGFSIFSSEMMSTGAVIEAINAKIASQFSGFSGGRK